MTVTINVGQVELEVTGKYYPGTPDVWYLPNGDPGYPGDSESFDIESVTYNGVEISDVIDAMNSLALSSHRKSSDDCLLSDLWIEIEERCIEKIN